MAILQPYTEVNDGFFYLLFLFIMIWVKEQNIIQRVCIYKGKWFIKDTGTCSINSTLFVQLLYLSPIHKHTNIRTGRIPKTTLSLPNPFPNFVHGFAFRHNSKQTSAERSTRTEQPHLLKKKISPSFQNKYLNGVCLQAIPLLR